MREIPGSEFTIEADLILLAMGFVGPIQAGLLDQAGVALDPRGNLAEATLGSGPRVDKAYACGDMRRGPSLVAGAICDGGQAAQIGQAAGRERVCLCGAI